MSNDPVNKQREAAAPFWDGEPDSRPEHSPYASQVCAVYFQGNGPLHIPHALLHQSVELTSRSVATDCFSSSLRGLHLDDIDYNTGHVLIHFMTTGRYQCPKPQGETIMMRYASEFTTALRVYAAAQSFQLPSLRDLARREMIALGDRLSLPSLVDIMEESSLSLSTLTGIAAYVESRILAFAENITYPTSEKVLSEIGTPNTLSMVLLKTILLLPTSKVSLRDDSLRKEEPVEIPRGLSDTGPIAKGKASVVDQVMKEAEEQAAKRAEEKAAAAAIAVAQRSAEAQATEAVHEEGEIACLLEKKARSGGWFLKRDQERLSTLEYNAAKRSEARAAREIAEAKTADALSAPAADKVDLSLLWAARNGCEAVVKMLLDTGKVDVDAKDYIGRTPLSLAAGNGHEAVVKMLVDTGKVDVDAKDEGGRTPLWWAARNGHEAVVKMLLDTGKVDVDAKNESGRTPLWWAAMKGHEAVVKMLVDTGKVDVDAKDETGQTPLSLAAGNGHEAVVNMLLDTGKVDHDAKDYIGWTPLSLAARNGHEAVVKMLLDTGKVDVDAKDVEYDRTPLSWAAENGHEAVVKMLVDTGKVDHDAKDKSGRTPLSLAARNGHEVVVKMLLDTGKVDLDA
jgi:ankyrin repeat protein